MIRLLTPADYRSMPWKNGAGRTTEIATHPQAAALDTFAWRVSIADVERDGPFSRFAGVDRAIVLLQGAGMRLSGGGDVELRTPFLPHTFSGDDAVDCGLVDGPVRDFNAMFRRGRARGTVAVIRGAGAQIAPADFRLTFAAAGAHELVVPGSAPIVVATGHAAIVEQPADWPPTPLALRPLSADAVALAVSIGCR